MKRFKFAVITFILLVVIVMTAYMYWSREQQINFSAKLPTEFNYCSKVINASDQEYIDLKNWLEWNQYGWTNSIAITEIEPITYTSENISINISDYKIAIGYISENGSSSYVIKETPSLLKQCDKK